MNLHGRKGEFLYDLCVLDRERFFDGFALNPFGREGRGGNRRAAAEGLELRVFDDVGLRIDFNLQLHHVAALGSADQAGAHIGVFFVHGADVARIVVVVDYFIAV